MTLECSECLEENPKCPTCGKIFKKEDKLFCFASSEGYDSDSHFCSKECWIKDVSKSWDTNIEANEVIDSEDI